MGLCQGWTCQSRGQRRPEPSAGPQRCAEGCSEVLGAPHLASWVVNFLDNMVEGYWWIPTWCVPGCQILRLCLPCAVSGLVWAAALDPGEQGPQPGFSVFPLALSLPAFPCHCPHVPASGWEKCRLLHGRALNISTNSLAELIVQEKFLGQHLFSSF